MIYYKSDFYEAKLRVDTEADVAFIKYDDTPDKEIELDSDSKIGTDIIGADNRITEAEYNQSESGTSEDTSEDD